MSKNDKSFSAKINEQKVTIVEMKDSSIKVIPLECPASGIHIIYNDDTGHHWDFYDPNRTKIPGQKVSLSGWESGKMYVCSGQNNFVIMSGAEVKAIPKEQMNIETRCSGQIFEVKTDAPGVIVYIQKNST